MPHSTTQPNSDGAFQGLIGVWREDITPPAGIYARSWGAAKHDVAEGVHRPLTLTALTFQSSASAPPLVLIAADLGWWKTREDEWSVRGPALKELGLDESQLMICLSHTHAGPSLVSEDAGKPGGELIGPYLQRLRDAVINAVRRALESRVPATLTWRYGRCDLATDRDLPDPARNRFIVGYNPAVAADDTLLVARAADEGGRIIASIVNYACHPTTLAWDNKLLSPDYVGAMREVIEAETKAPCAFLQGASGELAPAQQYVGDTRVADKHGRRLGFAALAALEGMLPPRTRLVHSETVESGAPLAVWLPEQATVSARATSHLESVTSALKPMPSLSEIEREWRQCDDRVMKERWWRKLAVRRSVGDGDTTSTPLWVWTLGEAVLIGQPNEPYSLFQRELRRHLAPRPVAVMGVVNGHSGYFPPRERYGSDVYSVWQTPFAEGSLEGLIDHAIRATIRDGG